MANDNSRKFKQNQKIICCLLYTSKDTSFFFFVFFPARSERVFTVLDAVEKMQVMTLKTCLYTDII